MKKTLLLASLAALSTAHAYEAQVKKGQLPATLEAMLTKATADTGVAFGDSNIQLIEERELATSNYSMYVQSSEMIPVAATAVRIWKDKKTGELILGEIHLDENHQKNQAVITQKYRKARFSPGSLKSQQLSMAIQNIVAKEVAASGSDNKIISMKFQDLWVKGDLVRKVEVRGRRGVHHISISLIKNAVVEKFYMEFPQAEALRTLKANIYPMYEEVEGTGQRLNYEVRDLKYINPSYHDGGESPFSDLGATKFVEDKYNPILAETEVGQAYGIWSEASIRRQIEKIVSALPVVANDFSSGLLLQGKYATINLHPGVKEAFPDINFSLRTGVNHMLAWKPNADGLYEATPLPGFFGKTITGENDLLARIPFRLPDHNPAKYINSGFDEAQVYYAVTTLMDSLGEMGFKDPELSTRPFHAFLYDPDISMRDNAYYTDNTINFTTYNPEMPNLARDNPTIWHELGHGVMERLMGAFLAFGDSKGGYGGLSEGMADFVAKLIVEHQTNGADFPGKYDFRIMNNTGLYLTNEFHDEGEAYGGAMADMLAMVVKAEGREGLFRFTDLTLETMRLTRNHPSLTARSWFEHMIYADSLGSVARASNQYAAVITQALDLRNFSFEKGFTPASLKVTSQFGELTNDSQASREKPVKACDASGTVAYDLKVQLTSGDAQFIKFPATVKVEYKKGALQGAIKWEGEASNPTVYTINSADEILDIPLKASMSCDLINTPDGSCKDYAYIQVYNQGGTKPVGKKRFYLQIKDKSTCI
jgi:hypothetical protein